MKCRKDHLDLYIDNRLSQGDRARLEAHLEQCPGCREELIGLQSITGMLSSWEAPEPDEGLFEQIISAIELEPSPWELELRRRKRVGRLLAWASSLTAMGVLTALFLVFMHYFGGMITERLLELGSKIGLVGLLTPDFQGAWNSIKSLTGIVATILKANQFLLPMLAILALLLVTMTREILADVQRVLGYRQSPHA